jgi:hypothetical protein
MLLPLIAPERAAFAETPMLAPFFSVAGVGTYPS